jgi:hypothetical protein
LVGIREISGLGSNPLLVLVPYLLGFQPDECMVVVGTKGSGGSLHVTQWVPLHQPDDPKRQSAASGTSSISTSRPGTRSGLCPRRVPVIDGRHRTRREVRYSR